MQENFSRVLVNGRWYSHATVTLAIVLKQFSNSYEDWGSQLEPLVLLCPCLGIQDWSLTAAQGDLLPWRDMQACPIHRGKDSRVVKFWLGSLQRSAVLQMPPASGHGSACCCCAPREEREKRREKCEGWYCSYGQSEQILLFHFNVLVQTSFCLAALAHPRTQQAHPGKYIYCFSAGPGHHTPTDTWGKQMMQTVLY